MGMKNKLKKNRIIFYIYEKLYKIIDNKKQKKHIVSPNVDNIYRYISICAVMKNEGPYLREWLEYHKLIGIEHFYLFDNESSDETESVLQSYIKEGVVDYFKITGQKMQMPVYNYVIERFKNNNRWIAFIDLDEFLLPVKEDNIVNVLKQYEEYSGICINWRTFDSNGLEKKPSGAVIRNFTRCYLDDNSFQNLHVKSIVNPQKVKFCNNPHFFYFNEGYAVLEDKEKIEGPFSSKNHGDVIRINHYFSKSKEEFIIKSQRGRADIGGQYSIEESKYNFKETKQDYTIQKYLDKLEIHLNNEKINNN